ncbi:ribosomal large subunit pseudouridine synthase B [Bacillus sp. M 2-6]|nr:ribosomal large subunit pseudouridine synthase B [Bacillus sp. M 2-6]
MENSFFVEIRQMKRLFFHECLFVSSQASKIVHEVKDKWNVYRK